LSTASWAKESVRPCWGAAVSRRGDPAKGTICTREKKLKDETLLNRATERGGVFGGRGTGKRGGKILIMIPWHRWPDTLGEKTRSIRGKNRQNFPYVAAN